MRVQCKVPARYLSIHKRHLALKSNEQVMVRNIQKLTVRALNEFTQDGRNPPKKILFHGAKLVLLMILSIVCIMTDFDELRTGKHG